MTPDGLGKADWKYDPEWDMHIPCCSILVESKSRAQLWACGNGPLVGDQISTGNCGEHGHGE